MSRVQSYRSQTGHFQGDYRATFGRNHSTITNSTSSATTTNDYYANSNHIRNYNNSHDFSNTYGDQLFTYNYVKPEVVPSLKRRKFSASSWENSGRPSFQFNARENASLTCINGSVLPAAPRPDTNACKRDRSKFEEDDVIFMSRDEIDRCSPSRKDGIDALQETHLRYSYCAFLQNLGVRLELPQTTIGTAMVLCHRFFVRRSHACHDRFLIATATLFLAAKSEETPCPLNNVLRASCEIFHKQDLSVLTYLLPVDWFEQYRERVIEAEQIILTTLNFELTVQHPYAPLTSILDKLGLSQSVLVNLALSLVSEGLRSSLWLQFKPHEIAAGAVYLASKSLNMDLSLYQSIWQEFQVPLSILKGMHKKMSD
ncbi:hypothetical protein RJ639_041652 [Escallonia herrerae]|uniref:Cyclin-like domain-containing protein n=1 Tax=Escallonia herrerae TaxID=1293975 RepID=A0AA88WI83_9ASTE|nr:hypothetical protein RJ639_041652 [Escallonia herrerae]